VWPGAGTGRGRTALLRAHPLLDRGAIAGEAFGRRLVSGTVEYERRAWTHPLASIGVAVFADAARAADRLAATGASPLFVDVGAGLRIRSAGLGGTLTLDAARATRGGRTVFSVNFIPR
jgi:hypothetical protein